MSDSELCLQEIGKRIMDRRKKLGLTQEALAEKGDVTTQFVSYAESGKIEIYNKGKYRRIFLPKILQKKLLSYCNNNQIAEGWIFVTKNGKLKDRSNIWKK